MIILDLFDTHHEKALKEGAVDSADQLNEYIPRRKDANYAEFAPGTRVKHNLLGPRVGTVIDVLAIPREDRRESGIPVQVGDRIYWMAPQGLVQVKGMAEGNKKKKKKKKSSRSLRGYFFPGYAYYGAGESGEGGGDGGGGESKNHGMAEGSQEINWVKPNFDFEWHEVEEQSRMKQVPVDVRQYYQKHFPNKDAWLKAVQNGKVVVVPPDHAYEIRNAPFDKASLQKVLAPTGHEGPIGPAKEKRVNDLFDKGQVEMPIILKTSQGLWLIGGKTRLGTANYVKGLPAKVWLISGKQGMAEGGPYDLPGKDYDRPGDMPRKQSGGEHNPYPYSPEEDDDYFREIFRKKREADKAKAQSGSLNELSTQKLAQYKTAAAADAKKSDAAGNYARGDRRFRGINQATIKQFANDAKTHNSTVKEQSSTGSEAVEQAILKRIMVSHTDLLMQFGPEKVMQAAEEVAYNVGDVDEIGTSDVSAYVRQVRQILGAE